MEKSTRGNIFSAFLIIAFLIPIHLEAVQNTQLVKNELSIDFNDVGFYKSISGLYCYKDMLFIIDFKGGKVLKFNYKNQLSFEKIIGNKGLGPGDIQKPISISIDRDIIAIKDQGSVSFFNIDGSYISKFRIFSSYMSMWLLNKRLYNLVSNPKSSHLFEVFCLDGNRIMTFGEEYLEIAYEIKKGLPFPLLKRELYDGDIFLDQNYIYYINKNFGILRKYNHSGDLILEESLIDLFGKNASNKVRHNKKEFLEKEYVLSKQNPKIGIKNIYLKARFVNDKFYFLLDQHNSLENRPIFQIKILCIEKNNLKLQSVYNYDLQDKEWLSCFAVKMMDEIPIFILDIKTQEGIELYEFRPAFK